MASMLVNTAMRDLALWTSEVLDITSFAVILLGVAISTAVFLARVWQTGFLANYRDYRANLGRGILIGLELLIAADILKSVVVDPTLQGIAVLGGIVAHPHLPVDLARRRDQRPLAVGDDTSRPAGRAQADAGRRNGPALIAPRHEVACRPGPRPAMISPTSTPPGGRNDLVRDDRLCPGAVRRGHLGIAAGQERVRLHPCRPQPRADARRVLGLCHLVRRRGDRGDDRRGLRQGHLRRASRSARLRFRSDRRRCALRRRAVAQGRHHLRRRVPRALLARRREARRDHPAAGLGVLGGGADPRLRPGAELQLRHVAVERHHTGGGAGRLLLGHRRPAGQLRHRLPARHRRHHRPRRADDCRHRGVGRRGPGAGRHAGRTPGASPRKRTERPSS